MQSMVLSILFIFFLASCKPSGTPGISSDKSLRYASMLNYDAWQDHWDKESWILVSEGQDSQDSAVTHSFINNLTGNLAEYASISGRQLKQQITGSLSLRALPGSLDGTGNITLLNFKNTLKQLKGVTPKQFAQALFLSNRTQGVAWSEPSLLSSIPQQSSRELLTPLTTSTAHHLNYIKHGAALQLISNQTGLSTQVLLKGEVIPGKTKEVVVAVIDTGVDLTHPLLTGRLWSNPGELGAAATDGVDNDGNGFVDDVHGIDASQGLVQDPLLSPPHGDDISFFNRKSEEVARLRNQLNLFDDFQAQGQCPSFGSARAQNDDTIKLMATCGHGTHVAGLIAGKRSQSNTHFSLCPMCRIMSLRVSPTRTVAVGSDMQSIYNDRIPDSAQIVALNYIKNSKTHVDIANLSLGKYFINKTIERLIQTISQKGTLFVAASGNEHSEVPSYPAAFPEVVSVCALNDAAPAMDSRAYFSNYGSWVDICSPGTSIYSSIPGSIDISEKNGTSQASPIVAGAIGFLKSYTNLSNDEIKKRLYAGSDSGIYDIEANKAFSEIKGDRGYFLLGYGKLNLEHAVKGIESSEAYRIKTSEESTKGGCIASLSHKPFSLSRSLNHFPFFLFLLWVFLAVRRKIGNSSTPL